MDVIKVSQMAARGLGTLALVLGFLVWPVGLTGTTPIHMLLGIFFVVAVLAVGAVALGKQGAPKGAAAGLLVLGLVTALLGLNQVTLMLGDLHWVIRLVHLALGMACLGLVEMVAVRTRRAAGGLPAA